MIKLLKDFYNGLQPNEKMLFRNAMLEKGAFRYEFGNVVTSKRGFLITF